MAAVGQGGAVRRFPGPGEFLSPAREKAIALPQILSTCIMSARAAITDGVTLLHSINPCSLPAVGLMSEDGVR